MARKLKKLDLTEIVFNPKIYGGKTPLAYEHPDIEGIFSFARKRHNFRITKYKDGTFAFSCLGPHDKPRSMWDFPSRILKRGAGALEVQACLLIIAEKYGG